MPEVPNRTEADAVSEIATAAAQRQVVTPSREDQFVPVPPGYALQKVEGRQRPEATIRRPQFADVASFNAYCKRWGIEDSEFYADVEKRSLHCNVDAPSLVAASYVDHVANLQLAFDRKFEEWKAQSGRWLDQVALAEFLESRHRDVVVPDGETAPSGLEMYQIAREFRLTRNLTFGSAMDLTTGESEFQFSQENKPGETVKFPEHIYIGLPIFRGGAPFQVKVRTRYRVNNGELRLMLEIVDLEETIDEAFELEVGEVGQAFPAHTVYRVTKPLAE